MSRNPKKFIAAAVGLALLLNFTCACAESGNATQDQPDPDNENNALGKLGRGIYNLAAFWLEVPAEMGRVNENSGPLKAGSWGLVKGVSKAFVRMFAGVYELVTFPIPLPAGYKPVLKDKEIFYSDRTW